MALLPKSWKFSWNELAKLCRKEVTKKEVSLPSVLHPTAYISSGKGAAHWQVEAGERKGRREAEP